MRKLILAVLLLSSSAFAAPALMCGIVTDQTGRAYVNTDGPGVNNTWVSKYTCPAMTVTSGALLKYSAATLTNGKAKMVIYAADGAAGAPGTLLGTSAELAVPSAGINVWINFTFSTPVVLAAGDYYLGYIVGGDAGGSLYTYRTALGGGTSYSKATTYASGPASPFGSGSAATLRLSLFVKSTPTDDPLKICGRNDYDTTVQASATLLANQKYTGYHACPAMTINGAHTLQIGTFASIPTVGQKLRAVIYNATNSTTPSTLVGMSDEVTVTDGAEQAKWVDFTFSPALVLPAGNYFTGFISSAAGFSEGVIPSTGATACNNADTYSDGPAASFGTCTLQNNFASELYLDGTAAGGGIPIIYIGQ